MQILGDLLRRQRQQRGLSQEELAALVDPPLSPDTISNLERGRTRPWRHTLDGLCTALGLEETSRREILAAWRASSIGASSAPIQGSRAEPAISVQPTPLIDGEQRRRPQHLSTLRHGAESHNLPAELSTFVGRTHEIGEVHRLLSTTRLLTLVGPGGVGKSRLAVRAARQARQHYEDGVWLVELAPVRDALLVPQSVAGALGLPEQPGRAAKDVLADALRSQRLLLVVDNCEHLLDACVDLIEHLLRSSPGLQVLATSRERLRSEGERVWLVPSLTLPPASAGIDTLGQFSAVQLFVERACAVRPGFALDQDNAAAVVEICRRLDGIPLALELAAARMAMLTPEQVVARLSDRLHLLTSGRRSAPLRHQTLRAAIEWSYSLLSDSERQLFARLSVFAGGWTFESGESVCCSDDLAPAEVLGVLGQLVDKSLVIAEPSRTGSVRYRMLETLHAFALECLAERGETEQVRVRHARFFLEFVDQNRPDQRTSGAWLPQLEREHENLRAALLWTEESRNTDIGLHLAVALDAFWERHASEGRRWLERLLSQTAPGATPIPIHAWALNAAGLRAQQQGDYARAEELHQEQLAVFEALADKRGIAAAVHNLGLVAQLRGDYELATVLGNRALCLCRELGDRRGLATALNALAEVARDQGDRQGATELGEQSLAVFVAIGDKQGETYALADLAEVARQQGDYQRVAALYQQNLMVQKELGDTRGTAFSLSGLGDVARHAGNHAEARRLYLKGLTLFWDLGDQWGLAECLEGLAGAVAFGGQPGSATRLLGSAEALRERIGAPLAPPDRSRYHASVAAARRGLTTDEFAANWSLGRTMPLAQIVAQARSTEAEPMGAPPPHDTSSHHAGIRLSRRERDVAVLVAEGLTNRRIAERLVISERTADGHVANVLAKLGMSSRAQIAAWAVECGLHTGAPPEQFRAPN